MKIPKTIKVGAKTYKVELTEMLHENGSCGVTHPDLGVIQLSDKLPKDELEITFLHEVLHACWNFAGISRENEEEVITQLSPILYTVLKENL